MGQSVEAFLNGFGVLTGIVEARSGDCYTINFGIFTIDVEWDLILVQET